MWFSRNIHRSTVLGTWSRIGRNCVVEKNVVFGDWAQIDDDVTLCEGVTLGTHTRVASGTKVPPHTRLGDTWLVTPHGIYHGRCSGWVQDGDFPHAQVTMVAGTFKNVPYPADQYINDYMFGRNDDLEKFRIDGEPPTFIPHEVAA